MLFLLESAFIPFFVALVSVRCSILHGSSSSLLNCMSLSRSCGMNCDATVITSV
jgi:hypothetical protein